MKIIVLFISLLFLFGINAQVTTMEWVKQSGGNDHDYGLAIQADANGNAYTTGYFNDTVDFDPNLGVTELISNGSRDVFVQKLDPNGNLVWVNQFGGPSTDEGSEIKVDEFGNVYTLGVFHGTVDFDPGADSTFLTSSSGPDIFLQKLSPNGDFIWAKRIGGWGFDYGEDFVIDNQGNILIGGSFKTDIDVDPGPNVVSLISTGQYDGFIMKLDSNGDYIWGKHFGGLDDDKCHNVAVDTSGNVIFTGIFENTGDFDPGIGVTTLNSTGSDDIFMVKLDSLGDFVWAQNMGGPSAEYPQGVLTDSTGNIFTATTFIGTGDFDPGPGTSTLTADGYTDLVFHKFDPNGDLIWLKHMGGDEDEFLFGIDIDDNYNIYATGQFDGTTNMNPTGTSAYISSSGNTDIFVLKLNSNGDLIWIKDFGGTSYDRPQAISVDINTNVYTTGNFRGGGDFDPGPGVANLQATPANYNDIFVHKLYQCQSEYHTDVQTACESFTWIDGNTYTSSNNVATHTLTNVLGCDSIINLDLTINSPNVGIDVQSACNSFTWTDGITYTSSNNTAVDTFVNVLGCDSIVTLNLTINSNTGTDVQSACNSFTWVDGVTYNSSNNSATWIETNTAGCDSVVTLDLTIHAPSYGTDVQTACESITWIDGVTYTADTDIPTWTTTNVHGCDSIVSLNFSIISIDTSVAFTDEITLEANVSGASYHWLDCTNGSLAIIGANSQSFTANSNGQYAVEITQNGCTDTSSCYTISTVSISDYLSLENLKFYPNPTSGKIKVELDKTYSDLSFTIKNAIGQTISLSKMDQGSHVELEINGEAGVYFIEIASNQDQPVILKLIKQ